MTLRRTRSALFSLPKFFKVDVVVFCEGGKATTVSQALACSPTVDTLDIIFWKNVVACFQDCRRFHFKSVGSKATLMSIANDAEQSHLRSVTVCSDSDYDRILGRAPGWKRIAYTCGYSWENDVLSEQVVLSVLRVLIGPPSQDAVARVRNARTRLQRELKAWCETDIELSRRLKSGVLDRQKPLSCADLTQQFPTLREAALRKRLRQCGYIRRPRSKIPVNESDVLSTVFGKFVSRVLYHGTVGEARRSISSLNCDYTNFMRLAISETFHAVAAGSLPILAAHFTAQRNAF